MQLLALLSFYLLGWDRIMAAEHINETTITLSKDIPKKSFDNVDDSPDHHPSSATALSKGNEWVWGIGFGVILYLEYTTTEDNKTNYGFDFSYYKIYDNRI